MVYVVDPGYVKQRTFNPTTGIDSLIVTPISRVAAVQRTGRAGRTTSGKCYRLYTEEVFNKSLPKVTIPEIQRINLSNTVLMLKVGPHVTNTTPCWTVLDWAVLYWSHDDL